MKIALVTKALYPIHTIGGMEKFYFNLAKNLAERGIEVEVITSTIKKSFYRKEFFERGKFKIKTFSPNLLVFSPKRLLYKAFSVNITSYLIKNNFDIVHGSIALFGYALFKNRHFILHVLELWDPPCAEAVTLGKRLYNYLLDYPFARYAFKKATKISVELDVQAKNIMKLYGIHQEKFIYLPPGIDLNIVDNILSNSDLTRQDIGLKENDFVLINVNRLEPNKGVTNLVKALRELNKTFDSKLILVGTGSQEKKIMKLITELGLEDKVLHFKNVSYDYLIKLYNLADIAVIPTLHEGLPTVLIEAMSVGKPIVASSTPEISSVVENYGNGILFPPNSTKHLVKAIKYIYDKNLIGPFGKRSRAIIKERFDWKKIIDGLVITYEEIIKS